MLLLIDVGNTKVKWRFDVSGSKGRVHQLLHENDWEVVSGAIAASVPSEYALVDVYLASVLGRATDNLAVALEGALAISVQRYLPTSREGGFVGCYSEPHKLGVDRWLAIMEAWSRHGASIVIDCGTAITIDAASADGQHLGGYIVPGFKMHFSALASGTTQVKISDDAKAQLQLGCDTGAAVRNGVVHMAVAFINDVVRGLRHELVNPAVYLLGGDAHRVAEYLDCTVMQDSSLILDGLSRVAKGRV